MTPSTRRSALVFASKAAVAVVALAGALLCPLVAQGRPAPTGRIVGQVVDRETRVPISGARVAVLGTARRATSDDQGRFIDDSLAAGRYVLQAKAIGYSVGSRVVELRDGDTHEALFELDRLAEVLDTVVVRRSQTFAEARLRAFERRRASGRGYFITAAQIEEQRPRDLSDLLRNVPGVRLTCRGAARCTVRMARAPQECRPDFVVDGFPATNSTSVEMSLVGVIGIEVYRTLSETPMEFLRADNTCGTIVIWTRSEPPPR